MNGEAEGYTLRPAGLSNQKYALLGLVLAAAENPARQLILPHLADYDQIAHSFAPVPLGAVFDLQPLHDVIERAGITVLPEVARPFRDGAEYFLRGGNAPGEMARAGRLGIDDLPFAFYRALRPRIRETEAFQAALSAVFRARGIRLVVQLRIEQDWERYARTNLGGLLAEHEDNTPGFARILEKVVNTLGDWRAGVYVTCDEPALPEPKDALRARARARFGMELLWKSDLLDPAVLAGMSHLERSLFDFEMAVDAPAFVGLTRSTFANLVSLERFARTRRHVDSHYFYNLLGPRLGLRGDEGLFCTVAEAIQRWPIDDPGEPALFSP